jgi:hypothetical protein
MHFNIKSIPLLREKQQIIYRDQLSIHINNANRTEMSWSDISLHI